MKTVILFTVLLLGCTTALAEDLLRIALVSPQCKVEEICGAAWRVFLDGKIDAYAAVRLAKELERNSVKDGFVFLNSPGGNLQAGMDLGRAIRRAGLITYVGKQESDRKSPGQCYSACVLAFVGGYFRYLDAASALGVHRFSSSAPSSADLEVAQIVSAKITSYLTEMGVDTALFELMSNIDKDAIYRISVTQAERLRVANQGRQPAIWTVEAIDTGLYLRGVQQAWWGIGKAVLVCGKSGQIIFWPFYEVGTKGEMIVSGTVRHSIRIDEEFTPLPTPFKPLAVDGDFISAAFELPVETLSKLKNAKSIGYAAHPPNEQIFVGFTIEVGNAKSKITGFINSCTAAGVR